MVLAMANTVSWNLTSSYTKKNRSIRTPSQLYVLNILQVLPSVSRSLLRIIVTGKGYLLSWQTSEFFLNTLPSHWHLSMKVNVVSPPYASCCGTNWPVDRLSPHPRVLQPCYEKYSHWFKFQKLKYHILSKLHNNELQ